MREHRDAYEPDDNAEPIDRGAPCVGLYWTAALSTAAAVFDPELKYMKTFEVQNGIPASKPRDTILQVISQTFYSLNPV